MAVTSVGAMAGSVGGHDDQVATARLEEALPGYRIDRLLSSGGMASVWLGRHLRLERAVAVKQLARGFAQDPDIRRRFRACLLYTSDAADE